MISKEDFKMLIEYLGLTPEQESIVNKILATKIEELRKDSSTPETTIEDLIDCMISEEYQEDANDDPLDNAINKLNHLCKRKNNDENKYLCYEDKDLESFVFYEYGKGIICASSKDEILCMVNKFIQCEENNKND